MRKIGCVLIGLLCALTVAGCASGGEQGGNQEFGEADLAAIVTSYYAGQDSPAYQMLHKSIFQKLLVNGWLEDLDGIANAQWNYDTFTRYTTDQASAVGNDLYCCTFSADDNRCGYLVISFEGDGLSKIEARETPYLYDLKANLASIQAELRKTPLDLTTATASRVQILNSDTAPREGIYFRDDQGNEYLYSFS